MTIANDAHVSTANTTGDAWAAWFRENRHGADASHLARMHVHIDAFRDKVLDNAHLGPADILADIGCGDGLIPFGAFDRVGPNLRVYGVDTSPALLEIAAANARARNVAEQCRFIVGDAEDLSAIPDGTVSVVTTRSVLAYVPRKLAAFRECFRILRPGGRISIGEPVYRDQAILLAVVAQQLRSAAPDDPRMEDLRFLHRWRSQQFPDSPATIDANPLTNYSERDLLRFAQQAGFRDLHVRLEIDVVPALPIPWATLLESAPLPGVPTLAEILAGSFTAEERARFERKFRAAYEAGTPTEEVAMAYLYATKPTV